MSIIEIVKHVDPDQLGRDVRINPVDLDSDIMEHASLFVHYANLASQARSQYDTMKAFVEISESKLYALHRELMTSDDKKKPTEAAIDAAVKADPRWFQMQKKLIDAKANYDLANDAREAFRQREGMLLARATDARREREGELRMGASKSVSDDLRASVLKLLEAQAQQKSSE